MSRFVRRQALARGGFACLLALGVAVANVAATAVGGSAATVVVLGAGKGTFADEIWTSSTKQGEFIKIDWTGSIRFSGITVRGAFHDYGPVYGASSMTGPSTSCTLNLNDNIAPLPNQSPGAVVAKLTGVCNIAGHRVPLSMTVASILTHMTQCPGPPPCVTSGPAEVVVTNPITVDGV